jgi:hypothetical protein
MEKEKAVSSTMRALVAIITCLTLAAPAFGQLTASQAPTPAPQQATELCQVLPRASGWPSGARAAHSFRFPPKDDRRQRGAGFNTPSPCPGSGPTSGPAGW